MNKTIKIFIDGQHVEFTEWETTQMVNNDRCYWEKSETEVLSSFIGKDITGEWQKIVFCIISYGKDTLNIRTNLHSVEIDNDRP